MSHFEHCSCGDAKDHEIARRQTCDGRTFYVWSDGTLTWGDVGRTSIRGIGRATSKTARARNRRVALVVADLALDADELVTAFRAGQRFAAQPGAFTADDNYWRSAILQALNRSNK